MRACNWMVVQTGSKLHRGSLSSDPSIFKHSPSLLEDCGVCHPLFLVCSPLLESYR